MGIAAARLGRERKGREMVRARRVMFIIGTLDGIIVRVVQRYEVQWSMQGIKGAQAASRRRGAAEQQKAEYTSQSKQSKASS